MKRYITILLSIGICGLLAEAENLLENSQFDQAKGPSVPGWIFPPSIARAHGEDMQFIERGGATAKSGESCLRLAVTKPIKSHLWWQQEVNVLPGSVYRLTVRYQGRAELEDEARSYASPDIGLYFLDTENSWIGYQRLKSAPKFDGEWHTAEMEVVVPENASKAGVRLGVLGNEVVEVFYDQANLSFVE